MKNKQPTTSKQNLKAFEMAKAIRFCTTHKFVIKMITAEEAESVSMTRNNLVKLTYEIFSKKARRSMNLTVTPTLSEILILAVNEKLTGRLQSGFPYRQAIDRVNRIKAIYAKGSISVLEVSKTRNEETCHTLYLNPLDNFKIIKGLVTIFRKADKNLPAIPCKWYEQSRGFELKEVQGFLVGNCQIKAKNSEKALKLVALYK